MSQYNVGFPSSSVSKESACSVGDLGQEDPLEKEMATHSSILAWKILWTEEPGRVQSMGSQRVGHNWATKHKHNENRIKIKGLPLLILVTVVSGMLKNVF